MRVFTPPDQARENGYIVLLVDDESSHGTSMTNAAEELAAIVYGRYHIPEARTQFIECYDYRHLERGHDELGRELSFARITFSTPTTAGEIFDFVHNTSLGRPSWTPMDRDAVESMIGEPLP